MRPGFSDRVLSVLPWPFHRDLPAVAGVALLARLPVLIVILINPGRALLASDAYQYLQLADNMRLHGVFSLDTAAPFAPDTFRTPGYPLFILPLTYLFGSSPLRALVILQMVLSVLTVCGVYLLARRLFDEKIGLVSGLFYAILPMPIIMAAYAYSETLFAACLVAASLLLFVGIDRRRWPLILLAGLVFGYAALVRPIGILLLPILLLIPLTRLRPRRAWLPALALTTGFMLLAGLWMGRNLILFDRFSLSAISDNNLFYYNVASTEAHRLHISIDDSRARLAARRDARPDDPTGWAFAREGQVARAVIRQHPLAFALYNARDALNGFRPGFSFMLSLIYDDLSQQPLDIFQFGSLSTILAAIRQQALLPILLELYMTLTLLLTFVGMLAGIVVLFLRRRWPALLLLAGIPAVLLYLPGIASNARFRTPAEVFLAMLAVLGFFSLLPMIRPSAADQAS